MNPCFSAGTAFRNQKLPASMPTSKKTPRARAWADGGIDFAICKNDRELLSKDMSVNVARAHFLENQILVASLRTRPEVIHDRNIREHAAFDRAVNRSPRHMFPIPRLSGPVVGGL